jgi:hypothetical protein
LDLSGRFHGPKICNRIAQKHNNFFKKYIIALVGCLDLWVPEFPKMNYPQQRVVCVICYKPPPSFSSFIDSVLSCCWSSCNSSGSCYIWLSHPEDIFRVENTWSQHNRLNFFNQKIPKTYFNNNIWFQIGLATAVGLRASRTLDTSFCFMEVNQFFFLWLAVVDFNTL